MGDNNDHLTDQQQKQDAAEQPVTEQPTSDQGDGATAEPVTEGEKPAAE